MDVAEVMGVSRRTVVSKRIGVTDWTLSEMLAIRALVAPDMTLDELFRREEAVL